MSMFPLIKSSVFSLAFFFLTSAPPAEVIVELDDPGTDSYVRLTITNTSITDVIVASPGTIGIGDFEYFNGTTSEARLRHLRSIGAN